MNIKNEISVYYFHSYKNLSKTSFLILAILVFIINNVCCFTPFIYDSYMNTYRDYSLSANTFDKIANTTWKEFSISEHVVDLVKSIPAYIDDDKELDLMILDAESRLYW